MARWFLWTLLAVGSWGLWAILGKLVGNDLSALHNQALSTLGMLPVIAVLMIAAKRRPEAKATQRGRGIGWAFAAGVLTCLGNMAYYDVLLRGAKAAQVVPLTALYPLVTVFLAVLFLRERLNRMQCLGLLLSFVSIYLFNVQTEHGFFSAWFFYALVPIALWGVAGLMQKISTVTISGERAAVWFLGAFVPVAGVILWLEPVRQPVAVETWVKVMALGLFFALGNLALLNAFANHGKAAVIGPLAGLYPVVSLPIAILVLGEKIGLRETAGAILALASVAALAMETRETAANLETVGEKTES